MRLRHVGFALLFARFGFSLAVNAWTFYRVSGGLFNPAVTLALFLTGTLGWFQLIHLTIAQIAVESQLPHSLPRFFRPINARTTLANGINVAQGFWLEFFLTTQLILVIFCLPLRSTEVLSCPVGIGLALFICELFGTNYTGGSLKPARTFGPDVVLGKSKATTDLLDRPYSAAIVSSGFYQGLKYFQYESANIGQDATKALRSSGCLRKRYRCSPRPWLLPSSSSLSRLLCPPRTRELLFSNSSQQHGLTAAGMVKKAREDKENTAAINLAPSEVHQSVA